VSKPKKGAPKKASAVAKKAPAPRTQNGKRSTPMVAVTTSSSKKSIAPGSDRRSVVDELKAEEHKREEVELGGWPAGVTTYRIGDMWICKIDNVSPGATVARARGKTRDEAVGTATAAATRRLAATRVHR